MYNIRGKVTSSRPETEMASLSIKWIEARPVGQQVGAVIGLDQCIHHFMPETTNAIDALSPQQKKKK